MQRSEAEVAACLRASRALVAIAARSIVEVNLTLPQFRVLVVLARSERCTVKQLAGVLGVHPSTVTRMMDRLTAKRVVRRVPGTVDRRETSLALTAAGRRVVGRVVARRSREVAAVLDRMAPADRQQLVQAMLAFSEAAEEPELDLLGWGDDREVDPPA